MTKRAQPAKVTDRALFVDSVREGAADFEAIEFAHRRTRNRARNKAARLARRKNRR